MDWSKSQSHSRNMRQQPISVHVHVHVHIKVQSLFPTVRTLRSKLDTRTTKKMSGTSDESETNLELLSKDDEIVDKKGSANSVIWKWFGYLKSDEAQIKTICKICRWFVKTKTGNQGWKLTFLSTGHCGWWISKSTSHSMFLPATFLFLTDNV